MYADVPTAVGASDVSLVGPDKAVGRAPRVLIISGGGDLANHSEQLARDLDAQGLSVQGKFLSDLDGKDATEQLVELGTDLAMKFSEGGFDPVIVHAHGLYDRQSETHRIPIRDFRSVAEMRSLLDVIIKAASIRSAETSADCVAFTAKLPLFHLVSCEIGKARRQLAGVSADILFYSGKKECESRDAFDTLSGVFREIGTAHRYGDPQPDAKALWLRALGISGENLTLIEQGSIHVHGPLKTSGLPAGMTIEPDENKDQRDLYAKLRHGSIRSLKAILAKHGVDTLKKTSFRGRPALHSAIDATRDCLEKIALLLASGLDRNERDVNGDSALHHAVIAMPPTELEGFLALSPDLEARNDMGHTALHSAVRTKDLKTVELIVRAMKSKGIDIDGKDDLGMTALMSAAYLSTPEIIRLLLHAGADPTHRGIHGKSALDLARLMNKPANANALAAEEIQSSVDRRD
jgi:hypothetical protein